MVLTFITIRQRAKVSKLGNCKKGCSHEYKDNYRFVCWRCGHVIKFTKKDFEFDDNQNTAEES